jgi:hypothetical protein
MTCCILVGSCHSERAEANNRTVTAFVTCSTAWKGLRKPLGPLNARPHTSSLATISTPEVYVAPSYLLSQVA